MKMHTTFPTLVFALSLAGATLSGAGHAAAGDVKNADCLFESADPDKVAAMPRKKVFVPRDQRDGLTQITMVLFGDMFAMNEDTPPLVSDSLRDLFTRADLVMGNIEAPLTYNGGKLALNSNQWFNFHANVAYVNSVMAQFCIDPKKAIFTLANNHSGDANWYKTVENARRIVGASFVGIDNYRASEPEILTRDVGPLRVGVVGWTHLQNSWPWISPFESYSTWEASLNVTEQPHTYWTEQRALHGIDMLIGLPHWDCQGSSSPRDYTIDMSDRLHERGFNLVAGAHQNSPQRSKTYGDDSNTDMTFFGLGDLTNALNVNVPNLVDINNNVLVSPVELVVDQDGRVLEYEVHPYVMHRTSVTLRGDDFCGDRPVTDLARLSKWEIIPLEDMPGVDAAAYDEAVLKLNRAYDPLLLEELGN